MTMITRRGQKMHPKAIAQKKKEKENAKKRKISLEMVDTMGTMMVETPPYFYHPFAVGGDVSAIPIETQGDGSVSYEQGYGPDYELPLLSDPDALPIGRETFNQVLFDVTTLLQQYSQFGTPPFITTDQNQGTPFAYPIYAVVYYGGVRYENQVASNTTTPGADNTWLPISGNAEGVLPGVVLEYAGFTAPVGYLLCNGNAVSRTTHSALLAAITQSQTGTTTDTSDTVTGLSDTSQMYIDMPLESVSFPPGTTVATIDMDGTTITASAPATASGAIAIRFFNWGNGDGSTTFNVPDHRRIVVMGAGGTASTDPLGVGNVVGQSGGEESHTMLITELVPHTHTVADFVDHGTSGTSEEVQQGSTNSGSTGGGNPFNIIQPTNVMNKIIKY